MLSYNNWLLRDQGRDQEECLLLQISLGQGGLGPDLLLDIFCTLQPTHFGSGCTTHLHVNGIIFCK
jgi:hypothetical protein